MTIYMLILSVVCLDGFNGELVAKYDNKDEPNKVLLQLNQSNKVDVKDHISCYVSEAQLTEEKSVETQE